jgi:hypothetical protein
LAVTGAVVRDRRWVATVVGGRVWSQWLLVERPDNVLVRDATCALNFDLDEKCVGRRLNLWRGKVCHKPCHFR